MENNRTSLLKKIMKGMYDSLNDIPPKFYAIYIGLIIIFYGLSCLGYWEFVANCNSILRGASLLAGIVLLSLIVKFDILVDAPESDYSGKVLDEYKESFKLKKILSTAWLTIMVAISVFALITSNKQCKEYQFDCSIFYTNQDHKTYHIFSTCKKLDKKNYGYTEIKGYEVVSEDYQLCTDCEIKWEDMDGPSAIPSRYR